MKVVFVFFLCLTYLVISTASNEKGMTEMIMRMQRTQSVVEISYVDIVCDSSAYSMLSDCP